MPENIIQLLDDTEVEVQTKKYGDGDQANDTMVDFISEDVADDGNTRDALFA